ncbi:hypothetical protein ACLVXG_21430 [Klebsiella pneumoniae]
MTTATMATPAKTKNENVSLRTFLGKVRISHQTQKNAYVSD